MNINVIVYGSGLKKGAVVCHGEGPVFYGDVLRFCFAIARPWP
jgi:hypothetical protein